MRMKYMFDDTHKAMLDLDARVLDVPALLSHHYYFRLVHADNGNDLLTLCLPCSALCASPGEQRCSASVHCLLSTLCSSYW